MKKRRSQASKSEFGNDQKYEGYSSYKEDMSNEFLIHNRDLKQQHHARRNSKNNRKSNTTKLSNKSRLENSPEQLNGLHMSDTENFKAVSKFDPGYVAQKQVDQKRALYDKSTKGRNLKGLNMSEYSTPGELDLTSPKFKRDRTPSNRKKKINKPLSEILASYGKDAEKMLELPNRSAMKYFDKVEDKMKVKDVLSGAFKTSRGKDYDKRLYGYTESDFLASVHNPYRIDAQNSASFGQDYGPLAFQRGEHTFWSKIFICHDNQYYIIFNVAITSLCLISSYYYASLVGFRYSSNGEIDVNYKTPTLVFESFFLIHMLSQFFLEYQEEGEPPVSDPFRIATHYLNTTFPLDLLCLIPFQFIEMKRNRQLLFFLIKMLRLIKGLSLFDVHEMMKYLKSLYMKKVQYIIDTDRELANDCDIDNTGIGELLKISYTLKTLKLIIIILNTSYITGILFMVLCEGVDDFINDIEFGEAGYAEMYKHEAPGFLAIYGLHDRSTAEAILISLYFAFTSLSTVGFGDYAPKGNIERFFGAFMLLFGVAIFSYIMGNFIDILHQAQTYNADLDDGDNLTKFFGIIQKFNFDKPIDKDLKERIEAHFDYRWQNDKLQAFREEKDLSIFEQMPEEVRIAMLTEYLFKDFLQSYRKTFSSFENMENFNQNAFYTWHDFHYKTFMESLLYLLEPRIEQRGVILQDELDEVNEVVFFENGQVDVGFCINRKQQFVIRLANDIQIGSYNITFNKRSKYIYRTSQTCTGFSIRRLNWKALINDTDFIMITEPLKKQIKKIYEEVIASRVVKEKAKLIAKWNERKDYDAMLRLVDTNNPKNNIDIALDVKSKTSEACKSEDEEYQDVDTQEGIDNSIYEYAYRQVNILQCFDQLYHDHIQTKSQNRMLTYENDKLRLQVQMLQNRYDKNGGERSPTHRPGIKSMILSPQGKLLTQNQFDKLRSPQAQISKNSQIDVVVPRKQYLSTVRGFKEGQRSRSSANQVVMDQQRANGDQFRLIDQQRFMADTRRVLQ